jgi:hypothetical protein
MTTSKQPMTQGMVPRVVISLAVVGVLACCAFPNDDRPSARIAACGHGQPRIGMTKAEVLDTAWCAPENIRTLESANGDWEDWDWYPENRALTFRDGVVTFIHR